VKGAVQVLQKIKELELRPAVDAEAWAKPLRDQRIFGRAFEPDEIERMSPDVRAVETGEMRQRLRQLALTGRVTEQQYRALTGQLLPMR
jgi:hypothetical protein